MAPEAFCDLTSVSKKTKTNHNSVSLLRIVLVFLKQTLVIAFLQFCVTHSLNMSSDMLSFQRVNHIANYVSPEKLVKPIKKVLQLTNFPVKLESTISVQFSYQNSVDI